MTAASLQQVTRPASTDADPSADLRSWWQSIRERAAEHFEQHGFPGKSLEAWKYSGFRSLPESALAASVSPDSGQVILAAPSANHYYVTLVDGRVDLAHSHIPDALSIIDWEEERAAVAPDAGQTLRQLYDPAMLTESAKAHRALNLAHATQSLVLRLPKGLQLDRPLELHHVSSDVPAGSRASQLWLWMEAGSQLTLLEYFYGTSGNTASTSSDRVTQLGQHLLSARMDRDAQLTHYRLQEAPLYSAHLYSAQLDLHDHSEYQAFSFTCGGGHSRQEVCAHLHGPHIRCDQQGVTLARHTQQHDTYLPVVHHAPGSYSNQHFRQLLDDRAKGVFYGRVEVPENSSKTEAHQLNHNMLLSAQAQAFTRPELDILTDDVVCSHGATVGHLDEQAFYYLLARGLSEDQARRLLIQAFAESMLETVSMPSMRQQMQARLANWAQA